jgi:hypothetical protein
MNNNSNNSNNTTNNEEEPSSSSSVFQSTVFGESSQEEMCIVYIMYYPRATLKFDVGGFSGELSYICGFDFENEACKATHQVQDLANNDLELNRIFGVAQCLVPIESTTTAPFVSVLPSFTATPVAMDDNTDATPAAAPSTPVLGPTTPAAAASSSASPFHCHSSTVLWVSLVSVWMIGGFGFTTFWI